MVAEGETGQPGHGPHGDEDQAEADDKAQGVEEKGQAFPLCSRLQYLRAADAAQVDRHHGQDAGRAERQQPGNEGTQK